MKFVFVLLSLLTTSAAWAQYVSYVASPSGVSYGASPSVLSLEIQTGYPRAIVRKNDWTAFQTTGTMRLYQDGYQIASATQYAGTTAVTIPFSWNFSSGTHNFYAITSTNPYASGSVSVTAGYIPAPPSGVTASATSSSAVTVSWNAVSGATRYKVRHVASGAQTGDLYSTSYSWTGLTANTNHCFVVLACAGSGFCSAPSAQACATTQTVAPEQYKVGVLFYRNKIVGPDPTDPDKDILTPMSWDEIGAELEKMKADIAGGRPNRVGNGKEVRLVVQLEVEWAFTEPSPGQYDFEWFKQFARLCEQKQIKWTPLLSPHYMPGWALSGYEPDRLRDLYGTVLTDPGYLDLSPSSLAWNGEVSNWVRAFVNAMAYDGAYNHFGRSAAIDEILIGNEMTYPWSVLTSKDAASQREWSNRYGTAFPTSFTSQFQTFRAEQLSYAINYMIQAARGRLDQVGASQVGVSSKLYPFYFPRTGTDMKDQWKGYTESSLGFLDSVFRGIFAIDSYPNNYCDGGSWSFHDDYAAGDNRTAKKLYVAEFNVPKDLEACRYTSLTRAQVKEAVVKGFDLYSVRAFTFLGWNPSGKDRNRTITAEQKLGLADAMNAVVP